MLAQQGLSLGQATVADGRADPQAGANGASPSRSDPFAGNAALDEVGPSSRTGVARGLIDVFA
jgi:hypothetical protein